MTNPAASLTAISLQLVGAILKNADYNLNPGRYHDVPTAKDEIRQAIAKLDQIVAILVHPEGCPTVNLACNCWEMGLEYACCKKEEYEALHDGDPETEWVSEDGRYVLKKSNKCCDLGCLKEGFQRCHAGHVGD